MAKNKRKKSFNLYLAALGFTAYAVCAFAVQGRAALGWETSVFDWIYSWPQFLKPIFIVITQLGNAWFLPVLCLAIWIWHKKSLAVRLLFSGTTAYLLVQIAKEIIARPRPEFLLDNVAIREPFVNGYGFPSGHSAMIMLAGIILWPHVKKQWRWLIPVVVALVGISRIYLGAHLPMDIIGGFAIGFIVAALTNFVSVKRSARRLQ